MAELGFRDHWSSGYTTRDASPDSAIFTLDSSFSLFSSASASADRCSFASDALDHNSFAPEFSPHLAGRGGDNGESRTGPDPDPNKALTVQNHSRLSRLAKKLIDKDARIEDGPQLLNSARNSFSLAVKDCRDRRSRSEALSQKLDRRRTASLDLKDVSGFSPRLGDVRKSSGSSHKYGAFPSPGTPPYFRGTVGMQKGWSSERVPSSTNGGRRQQVGTALVPLNSGMTLPSKWEDAERWIFSPVSRNGSLRQHIMPPQRRPKSKSGPLGPLGLAYYSLYSPAAPMFERGIEGSFVVGSPFSTGVIAADGSAICAGDYAAAFQVVSEPCMARSVSVHGCSNRQNQLPLPSQGDNIEGLKDAATDISRAVSRWDVATQMSPQGSTQSSPKRRPSFSSSTPTALHIVELQSVHCSKSEVRDVQVDERVTMTRWSNKHGAHQGRRSGIVDDWIMGTNNGQDSAWDVSESAKSISKLKREEAQITAWENLQKAKAEAAIRKLEMKLEKKRSSSMDKIMNKLKSAQKKAQEMRSSMVANQAGQVTRTCHKAISFHRARNIGSLSCCFTALNCMLPSA